MSSGEFNNNFKAARGGVFFCIFHSIRRRRLFSSGWIRSAFTYSWVCLASSERRELHLYVKIHNTNPMKEKNRIFNALCVSEQVSKKNIKYKETTSKGARDIQVKQLNYRRKILVCVLLKQKICGSVVLWKLGAHIFIMNTWDIFPHLITLLSTKRSFFSYLCLFVWRSTRRRSTDTREKKPSLWKKIHTWEFL